MSTPIIDTPAQEELKNQIKELSLKFSNSAQKDIGYREQILNSRIAELIELYQNQIRNIGIISGVVAPLSLTLLQTKDIIINVPLLLLGFILLLINIAVSQFLLSGELSRKNKLVNTAWREFVFASVDEFTMRNNGTWYLGDMHEMTEFSKSIKSFDNAPDLYGTDVINTNKRLQTYNKRVISIFSIGCGFIILSTIFNPLIEFLVDTSRENQIAPHVPQYEIPIPELKKNLLWITHP